jgi:hypothetical protein
MNPKDIETEFEFLKNITDFNSEHIDELCNEGIKQDRYSDCIPCTKF